MMALRRKMLENRIIAKYGVLGVCMAEGKPIANSLSNIIRCHGCKHLKVKERYFDVLRRGST